MFRLDGRVAIVTGGSRGIGLAVAKAYASAGAYVVLTARTEATLTQAVEAIQADGGSAEMVAFDMQDVDAGRELIERVIATHGKLDILVNNAGLNFRQPATEVTHENFDRIQGVNLRGPYFLAQAAARHMLAQGSGKIINIASIASFLGLAKLSAYAASKGALLQMTRAMATEWASGNVQVNAIAPGFIVTDLNRALWERDDVRDWVLGNTPARRLGKVEDLLGAAIFLASGASDYISGQTIVVDGGLLTGGAWPL